MAARICCGCGKLVYSANMPTPAQYQDNFCPNFGRCPITDFAGVNRMREQLEEHIGELGEQKG